MTFREFIASHRQVVAGRPADLRSPDFDILHAIEFARRHPEADTLDGLLGAARAELRIVERMPPGIYVELGRLFSLDLAAADTSSGRRRIGLPRRRIIT